MPRMSQAAGKLILQGQEAGRRGDHRHARELYASALTESRKANDLSGEAQALLELAGLAVTFDNDLDGGQLLYDESFKIYRRLGASQGCAYAIAGLARIARKRGNLEIALRQFTEALAFFEKTDDKHGQAVVLHEIGLIDKQKGDYLSAERHLRRCLLLFQGLENKSALAQVLLTLGNVNIEYHKDLQQAAALFSQALALFEELGLSREAEKARHNLAYVKSQQI
jgi:tetratricopeptide (TPR) repeat protein